MSEQTQTNGEAHAPESAEVVREKAAHRQAMVRLDYEHERELARMDGEAMRRMPLPLRMIFDDRLRQKIEQAALDMSQADGFVPKQLVGKPAACKVVLTKAIMWNLDPYAVALATYQTPDNKVAFEGKLYRAIAEASGELAGPIRYEYYGDWDQLPRPSFQIVEEPKETRDGRPYTVKIPKPLWEYWGKIEEGLGVRISGTLKTGEEVSIDFDLVDAYPRNATTWPTRPKLQLLNPAIRAFVNQVRPSLIMGVHFRDEPETEEVAPMRDITPVASADANRAGDPLTDIVEQSRSNTDKASEEAGELEEDGAATGEPEQTEDAKRGPGRPRLTPEDRLHRCLDDIAEIDDLKDAQGWNSRDYAKLTPDGKAQVDAALSAKVAELSEKPAVAVGVDESRDKPSPVGAWLGPDLVEHHGTVRLALDAVYAAMGNVSTGAEADALINHNLTLLGRGKTEAPDTVADIYATVDTIKRGTLV